MPNELPPEPKTKNTLTDLRNILFETLERVVEGDKDMDLPRAQLVVQISKEITATAKVEVDYIKACGGSDTSNFIERGKSRLGERRNLKPGDKKPYALPAKSEDAA